MRSLMWDQKVTNFMLHLLTAQRRVHEVTDTWTNLKSYDKNKEKKNCPYKKKMH